MRTQHEFQYPKVTEIPRAVVIPEHDDFADHLTLNHAEVERFDLPVDEYAKMLSRAGKTALRDVSLPQNVVDLEAFRHERNTPEAA